MRKKRYAVSSAAVLAVAFSTLFAGTASATNTLELDSIVEISAKGLESHQIFRNPGSELSNGKTVASKLRSSDIGVVIVSAKDAGNQSPESLADAIRETTNARYNTVITVVDGTKDSFGVSNDADAVKNKINSLLGAEPVKDAGWVLIENSENLTNVEEMVEQEAADAKEAAEKDETVNELLEFISNSWIVKLVIALTIIFSLLNFLRVLFTKERVGPELPKSSSKMVNTAFDDFKEIMYKHKKLSTPIYANCDKLMNVFVELEEVLDKTNASDAKRAMVEVTHVENLRKLTKALGPSHYLSMIEKPHQWTNMVPKKKLVNNAVETMINQVTESIHQMLEEYSMDTKIGLTRIVGIDSPTVDEFYRRASR